MSRTLLHVATEWPGHFPSGAATVALLVEMERKSTRFRGLTPRRRFTGRRAATTWRCSMRSSTPGPTSRLPARFWAGPPLAAATGFGQWHESLHSHPRSTVPALSKVNPLACDHHPGTRETHPDDGHARTQMRPRTYSPPLQSRGWLPLAHVVASKSFILGAFSNNTSCKLPTVPRVAFRMPGHWATMCTVLAGSSFVLLRKWSGQRHVSASTR
jgi:hypothetical protein